MRKLNPLVIQIPHQPAVLLLGFGVDIAFPQEIIDAEIVIGRNRGAKQVVATFHGELLHLVDEFSLQAQASIAFAHEKQFWLADL